MKINLKLLDREVEAHVEFPFYIKETFNGRYDDEELITHYSKVINESNEFCIKIARSSFDDSISEIELFYSTPLQLYLHKYSIIEHQLDRILGRGEYACTEEEYNAAMNEVIGFMKRN